MAIDILVTVQNRIMINVNSGRENTKYAKKINHLTPNGHFCDRTALLTYRCYIFLFIQQIYVLNILNMLHTLRIFLFKM
jgi:hypothetical protein